MTYKESMVGHIEVSVQVKVWAAPLFIRGTWRQSGTAEPNELIGVVTGGVGGACLEHLELRRKDEAYLNALGAERIPDPTTAGDFCRRFGTWDSSLCRNRFMKRD